MNWQEEELGNKQMDWCWVDFVEGEVDRELHADLKKLMNLCEESHRKVDYLIWTREAVKAIDPAHEEHLKSWDEKGSLARIMNGCKNKKIDQWEKGASWSGEDWDENKQTTLK